VHHLPLALTTTATVLAGHVWYVPALVTVRAGQDRARSARLGAFACLTGWAGAVLVATTLLLSADLRPALIAALLGAIATLGAGTGAAVARRHERRTEDPLWAELGCLAEGGTSARPGTGDRRGVGQ
jgi:hypothetical protein